MDTIKHTKHTFRRWAGGTNLLRQVSDDVFDCECGAMLRVEKQQVEHHLALPSTITIELLGPHINALVLDASEG